MRYFTGRIINWIRVLSTFKINENIISTVNDSSSYCAVIRGTMGVCAMDMEW